MLLRSSVSGLVLISVMGLAMAPPLSAQSTQEPNRRASGTVGASFGDGETALASSAALAFRLSPRIGLEFELAHARKLDFTFDLCPAPRVCARGGQLPVTGRTVSLVPHLVVELLPASHRLRAYAQAGVGPGHVRQRYFTGPPAESLAQPTELTRSKVVAVLSFGAGVSVRIARRFEVGADIRSLHALDEEADADRFITPSGVLSTLRVGSRASWRF